tara:strand:+ start:192 stop:476 length:285 start_codon:yes stop_codon:yes gene_type:complete
MAQQITQEESLEIITRNISEDEMKIMDLKNHRSHKLLKNTFRFTVSIISLDFLISLMEEEQVMNVYFNPSAPPPGTGIDGISLRYKVYVQYYER